MLGRTWSELRYRLRAIARRKTVERELDAELRFHVEREAEKYVRAGVPPAEARRRAHLALGGVERTKDDDRDARGVMLIDAVARDLRYAIRSLRMTPGFTVAVVATLALGIGATAGIFTVVDRLMFRPPTFLRDPSSVSRVYLSYAYRGDRNTSGGGIEYRRYLDLAQWSSSFSQVAAFADARMAVGVGQDATEMLVGRASASLFGFFDARPAAGRFYSAGEGLTDKQRDVNQGGVPILSSIPLLGGLFGHMSRHTTETELYLFITPHVIHTDDDAKNLTDPMLKRADRAKP